MIIKTVPEGAACAARRLRSGSAGTVWPDADFAFRGPWQDP